MRLLNMNKKNSQCALRTLAVCVSSVIALIVFDWHCLFKRITGLPCPGCGMTRAWFSLLKLDIEGAFYYHPLFWLAPVLVFVIALYMRKPARKLEFVLFVISGIFIAAYIIRLFLGWRG